jgi:hypothetical protein
VFVGYLGGKLLDALPSPGFSTIVGWAAPWYQGPK